MTDPAPDEAESVAEAMVQAQWGNGAAVTAQALREARVFIAAADALIACRMRLSTEKLAALTGGLAGRLSGGSACPHGVSYPLACGICLNSTTEQKIMDHRSASDLGGLDRRDDEDGA